MIPLLRLCRPYYAVPMASILMLTIWYAVGDAITDLWPSALCATVSLALVIAGGYALNDVCDRRADRINSPHRPIPAGQVSPKAAAGWACGLLLAGLSLGAFCRWQFLAALALVTVVLVFYNLTSKHLGMGKQLLVALLMTSFYPLAFAQAGPDATAARAATLYLFPVWLFLTSFGYEILKDIRDIRGDHIVAGEPSWIHRSPNRAIRLSRAAVMAGALVLVGPALTGCGWVYLIFLPLAVLLAVWSSVLPQRQAMMAIYAQCVVVGIAATADITILGP